MFSVTNYRSHSSYFKKNFKTFIRLLGSTQNLQEGPRPNLEDLQTRIMPKSPCQAAQWKSCCCHSWHWPQGSQQTPGQKMMAGTTVSQNTMSPHSPLQNGLHVLSLSSHPPFLKPSPNRQSLDHMPIPHLTGRLGKWVSGFLGNSPSIGRVFKKCRAATRHYRCQLTLSPISWTHPPPLTQC